MDKLIYTKYYLLNTDHEQFMQLLEGRKFEDRDLYGTYRVDFDSASGKYSYNEDIGMSEWGLETPMLVSEYKMLPDIYSACYGTIRDYRYDGTDGNSKLEYLREVVSASSVSQYFLVSHTASDEYVPPAAVGRYVTGWVVEKPWLAEESNYELLALSFCYNNPKPDIFKTYRLPLIKPSDWGKYLHINTGNGTLEWHPVDGMSDLSWILERLSQISGIGPADHPVIPAIASEAFSPGTHMLFQASLPDYAGAGAAVSASSAFGPDGNPVPGTERMLNCAWHLEDGDFDYLVFEFRLPSLPEPGGSVSISIGGCEFKHALRIDMPEYSGDSDNNEAPDECILGTIPNLQYFESNYIYNPETGDLDISDEPQEFFGVYGSIILRPSRLSAVLLQLPFEFRFSTDNNPLEPPAGPGAD